MAIFDEIENIMSEDSAQEKQIKIQAKRQEDQQAEQALQQEDRTKEQEKEQEDRKAEQDMQSNEVNEMSILDEITTIFYETTNINEMSMEAIERSLIELKARFFSKQISRQMFDSQVAHLHALAKLAAKKT